MIADRPSNAAWPHNVWAFKQKGSTRTRGFTLLEILVALLVLSVGLIGVAALTVTSLQNVHSGLYTSLASAAGLDYEERLWLQVAGLPPASGNVECPFHAGAFAQTFITDWTATNARLGLPGLTLLNGGATSIGAAPPLRMRIDISWTDSRFDSIEREGDLQVVGREVFRYVAASPCRRPL